MRFWLSESERRPDPAPARADARKALLVGTAGWVVALVFVLLFRADLAAAGLGWLLWAAITGTVIGVVGFVVVELVRLRVRRQERDSAD